MSGIGDILEKRISDAKENPKKARARGMLIDGTETIVVGLKTERKRKEFKPISCPQGLCYHDGLPCIDRLCYTGCENCSESRNIEKIKATRAIENKPMKRSLRRKVIEK